MEATWQPSSPPPCNKHGISMGESGLLRSIFSVLKRSPVEVTNGSPSLKDASSVTGFADVIVFFW